jgi:hypothetical protein
MFCCMSVRVYAPYSPINREFYLAKGTEKFILGRYLLSGILLIFLSLRPWGVAARPVILENRGAKSHVCDYFIIRARYLYLSYYRKCRACNSLNFLLFMFFIFPTTTKKKPLIFGIPSNFKYYSTELRTKHTLVTMVTTTVCNDFIAHRLEGI